ncbi:gamma-glutamylcyclotransferase [bacterium]|nr:MAG: gamma-glutamylcyclotransferase [bacterium]
MRCSGATGTARRHHRGRIDRAGAGSGGALHRACDRLGARSAAWLRHRRLEGVSVEQLLFVYGTLRRGREHAPRLERARFVARATARGRLYLCHWPAFVDGAGFVVGELYAVDEDLLALLDAFEGEGCLYARERREVRDEYGGRRDAWLYRWLGSVDGCRPIPSGDVSRVRSVP